MIVWCPRCRTDIRARPTHWYLFQQAFGRKPGHCDAPCIPVARTKLRHAKWTTRITRTVRGGSQEGTISWMEKSNKPFPLKLWPRAGAFVFVREHAKSTNKTREAYGALGFFCLLHVTRWQSQHIQRCAYLCMQHSRLRFVADMCTRPMHGYFFLDASARLPPGRAFLLTCHCFVWIQLYTNARRGTGHVLCVSLHAQGSLQAYRGR